MNTTYSVQCLTNIAVEFELVLIGLMMVNVTKYVLDFVAACGGRAVLESGHGLLYHKVLILHYADQVIVALPNLHTLLTKHPTAHTF